jgi:hypothetical protein
MVLRLKKISSYWLLNHLVFFDEIPDTKIRTCQVVTVEKFKNKL